MFRLKIFLTRIDTYDNACANSKQTFGSNRKKRNDSKKIAERIGVSRSQISCYLHNKKMPALDTFANLCKVLDVSADDILCIDD